jgi:hypothetical protein
VKKKNNIILETFLRLTNKTYPYGTEDGLVENMIACGLFPSDLEKDKNGNYFYKIGDSRTVFASHLDTVCREQTSVTHTFDGDLIKTDGKTTLGADDKAGVTILLHLMRNKIPGLYYFFIGEEVGCIGSGLAAKSGDFNGKYDRIISFDRKDLGSVITYQSSSRCCSDTFADALALQLNKSGYGLSYKKDDGGVYTDSAEFVDIIPECTNLSVGYYKEHTVNESQNIKHLEKLAEACLKVDWENLPTKRDPSKTEYKSYNYGARTKTYETYDSSYSGRSSNWRNRNKDYGYHDDWYGQSDVNTDSWDKSPSSWPGEEEYDGNFKKSNRRNKSRSYFDNGGELVPFKESQKVYSTDTLSKNNQNYYDSVIDKIIDEKMTKEEVEVVKEQYLDMTNDNDRLFYQYLLGNIID